MNGGLRGQLPLSPQSHLPVILRYSALRLASFVAISLVLSFIEFMRYQHLEATGRIGVRALIMTVTMAVSALAFAVKLLARDDTAVAADDTHIELVTLWTRHLLRWDELPNLQIMKHGLCAKRGGKNIYVPLMLITKDDAALQWLLGGQRTGPSGDALRPRDPSARAWRLSDGRPAFVAPANPGFTPRTTRAAPLSAPMPVMAMPPSDAELASEFAMAQSAQGDNGEFCPDAALNRYLARRDATPAAAPDASTKAAPMAASPIPRAPIGAMAGRRPSFGRKSA